MRLGIGPLLLSLCLMSPVAAFAGCEVLAPQETPDVDVRFKGKIQGEAGTVFNRLASGQGSVEGEFEKIDRYGYSESQKLFYCRTLIYLACIQPKAGVDLNKMLELLIHDKPSSANISSLSRVEKGTSERGGAATQQLGSTPTRFSKLLDYNVNPNEAFPFSVPDQCNIRFRSLTNDRNYLFGYGVYTASGAKLGGGGSVGSRQIDLDLPAGNYILKMSVRRDAVNAVVEAVAVCIR